MVPRRVKSAPGAIELNQHFGAETDLLALECSDGSSHSCTSNFTCAEFNLRVNCNDE